MRAGGLVEVEPARWDALLGSLGVADVYYARGFVAASAPLAGGTPVLLHLPGEDGDAVFPCLVRSDPPDVVTPYGYGGPAGTGPTPPLAAFAEAYAGWCAARGIVSSFVVFHPLLGNAAAAGTLGYRAAPLAGTVAWPLAPGADLLAGMHKHHRRIARRARAAGLRVEATPAPADLSAFVDLYEQTMRRTDAAPFYFFPRSYWAALASDVPLVQVDVRQGGTLVASVLGMGGPPWLHYHLGGSSDAGRGTGASHLALLGLAEWGRDQGYTTLHLGGGVGGRADSLLEYKRRFAPDGLVGAAIGKAVHDRAAYLARSGGAEIDWDAFFPAYREPH